MNIFFYYYSSRYLYLNDCKLKKVEFNTPESQNNSKLLYFTLQIN